MTNAQDKDTFRMNPGLRAERRGPLRSKHRGPFPNQIRRLRFAADLTQEELAEHVCVQRQHLARAELTGKGLSRHAWYRIAAHFGLRPEELEVPDKHADFYDTLPRG